MITNFASFFSQQQLPTLTVLILFCYVLATDFFPVLGLSDLQEVGTLPISEKTAIETHWDLKKKGLERLIEALRSVDPIERKEIILNSQKRRLSDASPAPDPTKTHATNLHPMSQMSSDRQTVNSIIERFKYLESVRAAEDVDEQLKQIQYLGHQTPPLGQHGVIPFDSQRNAVKSSPRSGKLGQRRRNKDMGDGRQRGRRYRHEI